MKAILVVLSGLLVIFGGEVLKQSLTDWVQITTLPFIAGLFVQIGGLIGAIVGGVNFDPSIKTFIPKKDQPS
jgi:hypothetical protein